MTVAIQALKHREGLPATRPLYPRFEVVAGFGVTVSVTSVTDSVSMLRVMGFDHSSNATIGALFGGEYYAGAGEYDPGFVARVLRADAAPAEATFDNVVDLLDWLDRDD